MNSPNLLIKRAIKSVASIAKARVGFPPLASGSVNIFAYHRVAADIAKAENEAFYGIVVSSETFRRHCELLRKAYDVVSLETAMYFLSGERQVKRPLAVITFDDGYLDFYEEAFPILNEFGFPATVFLPTDCIGQTKPLAHDRIFWLLKQVFEKSIPIENALLRADMKSKTAREFAAIKNRLKLTEAFVYLRHDLREKVMKSGARNSLLLAPMPTASTSQILGNNECFEPYTTNIYTRRTLSGEHIVVNKHLLNDLVRLGLWNDETRQIIIAANGSIQNIEGLPDVLKALYKTSWELSMKAIIDMSADRGAFICQSQSLNLFMESATFSKMTSMHFYAWQKGLKTGMYYLRTRPAADPIKFTLSAKHQRVRSAEYADVSTPSVNLMSSPTLVEDIPTQVKIDFSAIKTITAKELVEAENFPNACSLDDPDCMACSA